MLLAIGIGMTSSVWALEKDANGVYQISSAQDLVSLAQLVNSGQEMTANAVLTTDIDMSEVASNWTAIGDWGEKSKTASAAYKGHFDGKGHIITGFNATSSHNYYGIFGVISTGALIENFTIYGTMSLGHKTGGVVGYSRDATPTIRNIHSYLKINCTEAATTAQRAGGILGSAVNGTTVIENCTYSDTINVGGHTGNIGGIVGYVNNNTAAIVNITNCLFDGKILNGTADGQCGGIVGYNNAGKVTIKNCLSIGTITTGSGNDGMFFGRLNGTNSVFANNYYIGNNVNGTKSGKSAKGSEPVKVTELRLKSGEICYLLNGSTNGTIWYQTKGINDYPVLTNTSKRIYKNLAGEFININGPLQIGNKNDFKDFATMVNNGGTNLDAILNADIDLKDVEIAPIGNASNKYTGTFDGQGHAIRNFNYTATSDGGNGLFGYVRNATIKNFSIDGTLTSTNYTYNGTIGAAEANTKISGISSAINITVANKSAHTGGILGSTVTSGNPVLVEGCEYSGILTHSETGDCQAGILGYTYDGGVKNCIFSGTIIGASSKYGGILGYCKIPSFLGVQNCLSIGKIIANEGNTTAAAIIGNWNGEKTNNVKNNYYCLQDESTTTIAIGNKASNCEEPVLVTDEQLASGEVAYKLGSAFYQTIGTDNEPTLDNTHGIVKKISDAKFATTYFSGTDVTIPEDVTAYAAAVNDGKVVLSAIEDKIADGDAVVLNGEEGYYSFVPTTGASKAANNDLKISDGNVATDAKNNVYALAKNGTKVGFRIVGNGVKIPAGKAYLKVAAGAGVKEFYPFGEEETGLTPTFSEGEGAVYDLSGRLVNSLKKGIYIANGKKVLF